MEGHILAQNPRNKPCVCGNLDPTGKPVKYKYCCGDKPEEGKMYYDKEIPEKLMSQLQIFQPFFSSHPDLESIGVTLTVDRTINFNVLDQTLLGMLFRKGIPVYNPKSAFSYEFAKLNRYLPKSVNKDKFFRIIIDLLYNEWSIDVGRISFEQTYLLNQKEIEQQEKIDGQRFADIIRQETGDIVNPNTLPDGSLRIAELKAKWFLDDMIFRIRAQWDKIIYLLTDGLLNINLTSEKLGNRQKGKIGELIRKCEINDDQKKFFNVLIGLLCKLDQLRDYRDPSLHSISPRVKKALEHSENDETVLELWEMVQSEHNKVREGFFSALGIVVYSTINSN